MPAFLFVKYEIIILKKIRLIRVIRGFKYKMNGFQSYQVIFSLSKFVAFFIEAQFFVCLYQRFTYGVLPWLPV